MKKTPFSSEELDPSIHPADDFFRYVNGKWIKRTVIPADLSRWGSFDELREESTRTLREILESLARKKNATLTAEEQKLKNLYITGIKEKERDKQGHKTLIPYLNQIKNIERDALPALLAELNKINLDPFFTILFDQDDKDSTKQIIRLHQGGIGMPDREYYLRTDKKSKLVRKKYLRYIRKMFSLIGYDTKKAKHAAGAVLDIETKLAHAALPKAETRDPIKNYNKKKVAALGKEFGPFPWKNYFSFLRKKEIREIIVDQPKFLLIASRMLADLPLPDIRLYFIWFLINGYAFALDGDFRAASFEFNGKIIGGKKKQRPLWKQVVVIADMLMGDALGKLYVKKYFKKESRRQMNELVEDIKKTFKDRIEKLDWMDGKTRKGALKKLATLNTKIGYPKKWERYERVRIGRESFAENVLNLSRFSFAKEMVKVGGKPDRDEWHMSPSTVNAYYSPNYNEIVFPAAILQPPFFDPKRDISLNYGAIGAVIGHEISHAFDDSGSKFDHKGNMANWWTKRSRAAFEKQAKILIRQYDAYSVAGESVNGKLTLGENIADLCGAVVSYHAYQKYLRRKKDAGAEKEFSPEQKFFMGIALSERAKVRPEYEILTVRSDPHSPAKFRVNGILKNMPEFLKAFNATKKHRLYLPLNKQVKIW